MKIISTLLLVLFTVVAVQAQTLLTEDFENGIPSTWTIIDADGDGYLWISSVNISGAPGHNGSVGCAYSQSYNDSQGALTPDNWLITPAVALTGNASLTFWVCAQDAAYAAEHYGVYISTTSNTDISTFTLLMEETLDENGGAKTQSPWKKKTIDLSDYTGNTVYIAFRHYNCSDMFYLDLDDVEIFAHPTSPTIIADVSDIDFGVCAVGNPRTRKVTVTSYNLTVGVTATATTPFEVSANGTNFGTTATIPASGGMLYVRYLPMVEGPSSGTVTLASSGVSDITINLSGTAIECISTIPYYSNFDNTAAGCWEIIDANNDGNTFQIDTTNYWAIYTYNSYSSADDWLISPSFTLDGGQVVSFDYTASSPVYPEKFQVFAIGDDTVALTPIITVENTDPITKYLDISALTGNYKIAFHCISDADMYHLYIDNFSVVPITSMLNVSTNGLDFGEIPMNSDSIQTFTFTTINVADPIVVTTVAPFKVSIDGNTFSTMVTLPGNSNMVDEYVVYAKFAPTTENSFSKKLYVITEMLSDSLILTGESVNCSTVITSLPYTYDFNSGYYPPTCWTVVNPYNYARANVGSENGDYYLCIEAEDMLITPEIQPTSQMKLSFDYYDLFGSKAISPTKFRVGYSFTDNNAESFTWQAETESGRDSVNTFLTYFTDIPAGTKYIAIEITEMGLGLLYNIYNYPNHFYLDNFTLTYVETPSDMIVSTIPSNRNVLLEVFTGHNVQYCPDGHRIANEVKAAHPDRVCVINIHQGVYANNTYTTAFGDSLAQQSGLLGFPSGTINRHVFADSVTSLGRGVWPQYANQVLNTPSPVNIAAVGTLDMSTRKLTVQVQLYYTGSQSVTSNALNIAVLQDHVLGYQAGMDSNPDQIVGDQYSHMHMLRHLIAGQWGETIYNIAQGSLVKKTYEYVIPDQLGSPNPIDAMLEDLKFVAFVSEGHQEVLTCVEVPVSRLNIPAIAGYITRVYEIPNLTCSAQTDADFEFLNQGSNPVTSLTYTYSVGGTTRTASWNGNVGSFEKTTVHIPTLDIEVNTDNTLTVQVTKINGTNVDVSPKTLTIRKNVYSGSGSMLLTLVTDRYASETTFNIFDSNGSVVLSGGPWEDFNSATTTLHEFLFEPQSTGCYRLEVYDSYGDGFNAGYGEGYFSMTQVQDGVQLFYDNGRFGKQATYMIDVTSVNNCGIALDESNDYTYFENFDSFTTSTTAATGVEPTCWELVRVDAQSMPNDKRPQLYYKSTFAHSGDYSLLLNYRGVYAMPELSEETDVPINRVKLDMYLRQPNAAYRLEVGVWDDATNTFTPVALFNNSTTGVEPVTCDFSSYNGNGNRIAFRNVLKSGVNYAYSYNYIDDITLTEMVDCSITLPYSENFEGFTENTTTATDVEPTCWELVRTDATSMPNDKRPQLYYRSDFAHSGDYSLLLNYRGVYAMPELSEETDVPINRVKLDMYLRQPNAAYRLEVGVWDDATNTFTPVALFNNSTTGVEPVTCDFSSYNGNGNRIAFRNVLKSGVNYAYSYNYIDDITLTEMVDCSITLPYSENFEGFTESTTAATGVEPTCWELVRTDAPSMPDDKRPQLYYKSDFAHSGNYSLKLYNRGVYAMPELAQDVTVSSLKLEMYLRQANAAYQLQVGVWDGQTFVPVATFNNSTTNVEFVTCDFSNYNGNGNRIAFRNTLGSGTYAYSVNYLDDITLTVMQDCSIVLPYSEPFESYTTSTTAATGVQPDCWELVRTDAASMPDDKRPQIYYNSSFAHSGDYTLKMGNRCVYAMSELEPNVPVNQISLDMYLRQPNAAYQLEVGVWDGQEFVPVATFNNSTTAVEHVTCDFSNYNGNGRRVAFRNTLNNGKTWDYSYNYLDDINLTFVTNKSAEVTNANTTDAGMLGADRDMVDIVIYPNPTRDYINVECTMNNVQCSGIEVIDIYGKVVRTVVGANNDSPTQINVSGLAAGMYFVRVTTDKGVVTRPFVKR